VDTGYTLKSLVFIEKTANSIRVGLYIDELGISIESIDIRSLSLYNYSNINLNIYQTQSGFIENTYVDSGSYNYSAASAYGVITDDVGFVTIEIDSTSLSFEDIGFSIDEILINDVYVNLLTKTHQ